MKRALQSFAIAALLAVPAFAAKTGGLSLVPSNAVSVGVIRLNDMRNSPLSSLLFQHTDQVGTRGEGDKFLTDAGLDPKKDVDVLVVATTPRTTLGKEADILAIAEGRFDTGRLVNALVARGAVKKSASNVAYYVIPEKNQDKRAAHETGAVAFLGGGIAVAGNETSVVNALQANANGGTNFAMSGLGLDLAKVDTNATAWAIVDVTRAKRLTGHGPNVAAGRNGDAVNAAIKNVSTVALWATDTGDSLQLNAFGVAADDDTLVLLEDTLRGVLSAARLAVQEKSPDMVSVLRKFTVGRDNKAVTISGTIPADALRRLTAKRHASK
jgi:hypothetical protein